MGFCSLYHGGRRGHSTADLASVLQASTATGLRIKLIAKAIQVKSII
jgi:hypothetical protein